jgi:hypothetical protein
MMTLKVCVWGWGCNGNAPPPMVIGTEDVTVLITTFFSDMLCSPQNNLTEIHIYTIAYIKKITIIQIVSQVDATRDHIFLFCFTSV